MARKEVEVKLNGMSDLAASRLVLDLEKRFEDVARQRARVYRLGKEMVRYMESEETLTMVQSPSDNPIDGLKLAIRELRDAVATFTTVAWGLGHDRDEIDGWVEAVKEAAIGEGTYHHFTAS